MSWVVDSPQLVAVDLLSFICHPWSSCSMDIIHWIIIIINPQDSSSWWLWPSIQVKTINSPLQRNSQAVNCQSVTFDRTSSSLLRIFLNGSFHCSYVHFNIMMMMSYLLISLHYCTATRTEKKLHRLGKIPENSWFYLQNSWIYSMFYFGWDMYARK